MRKSQLETDAAVADRIIAAILEDLRFYRATGYADWLRAARHRMAVLRGVFAR